MTASDVVRDPLGQLNLTLWMAQPVPPEFPIRPLLREAGYRLLYLAPPMPLLPGIRDQLQAAGVPFVAAPEPDVLLSAEQGQAYLTLECKRTMFGVDSSSADQARALLLQSGEQLNTVLGLPLDANTANHLLYVTEHQDEPNPAEGVAQVSDDLQAAGFAVAPAGVVCLEARPEALYLLDEYTPGSIPSGLGDLVGAETRVLDLVEGEDPLPLLLVPWDPSVDQRSPMAQAGKDAFYQLLIAGLMVRLGKLAPGRTLELSYDELLDEALGGVYQRWRSPTSRQALRTFCRKLLVETLDGLPDLVHEPLGSGNPGRRVTFTTEAALEAARDALTERSRRRSPEINLQQPSLPFGDEE